MNTKRIILVLAILISQSINHQLPRDRLLIEYGTIHEFCCGELVVQTNFRGIFGRFDWERKTRYKSVNLVIGTICFCCSNICLRVNIRINLCSWLRVIVGKPIVAVLNRLVPICVLDLEWLLGNQESPSWINWWRIKIREKSRSRGDIVLRVNIWRQFVFLTWSDRWETNSRRLESIGDE